MVRAINRWRFPSIAEESTVEYPFGFTPDSHGIRPIVHGRRRGCPFIDNVIDRKTKISIPSTAVAATVINGTLYAFGSRALNAESEQTHEVIAWVYSECHNSWSKTSFALKKPWHPLPEMFVTQDRVVFIGTHRSPGFKSATRALVFDPKCPV